MPSSYTSSGRLEKQFTGENINLWGDKLDATLDRVDDFVAGFVALTITGDYTLSSANVNSSADEARRQHLKLTGTPPLNFSVTIPSVSKSYWMWNSTAKVATITTGSGSTVTIDGGDVIYLWCDGSNVKQTTYGGYGLKDYITSFVASSGSMPSPIGNAGKFTYSDGASVLWRAIASTDLSDYATRILGVQVALAVAL